MKSKFEIDMKEWAQKTEKKALAFAQEFMIDMAEEVIDATPVDTGFLRGSWDAYINDPSAKETGRSDPSGSTSIASISLTVNGIKIGDVIYMLNSANYASPLEFGTQYIAPRAFVRGSLAQARTIAERTLKKINSRSRKK